MLLMWTSSRQADWLISGSEVVLTVWSQMPFKILDCGGTKETRNNVRLEFIFLFRAPSVRACSQYSAESENVALFFWTGCLMLWTESSARGWMAVMKSRWELVWDNRSRKQNYMQDCLWASSSGLVWFILSGSIVWLLKALLARRDNSWETRRCTHHFQDLLLHLVDAAVLLDGAQWQRVSITGHKTSDDTI